LLSFYVSRKTRSKRFFFKVPKKNEDPKKKLMPLKKKSSDRKCRKLNNQKIPKEKIPTHKKRKKKRKKRKMRKMRKWMKGKRKKRKGKRKVTKVRKVKSLSGRFRKRNLKILH